MKIAYIMSRFPHLPETFILREMIEAERLGVEISLYPLICQQQKIIHQEAQEWLSRANCLPFLSFKILADNFMMFVKSPLRYLWLWLKITIENIRSPKFLLRAYILFPKSVAFARQMQQEGIQHIHAHYATHPTLAAWLIYQLTGISYSITVHAHDIFVDTTMLSTKIRHAKFIAAISQYNRDHVCNVVGEWAREKIDIVHCGIIPDNYTHTPVKQKKEHPFTIINIGSLQPYKGQSYLIQACAALRDKNLDFKCRIIGMGEEHANLQYLIDKLNLQDYVELAGPKTQSEVAEILSNASCYVQPSIITPSGKMEGIPVALMEAMACAVPVIATSISGIPELVHHNQTGYLIPPQNSDALATAIEKIYHNANANSTIGKAGQALVLKEFTLADNTNKLVQLYNKYCCA